MLGVKAGPGVTGNKCCRYRKAWFRISSPVFSSQNKALKERPQRGKQNPAERQSDTSTWSGWKPTPPWVLQEPINLLMLWDSGTCIWKRPFSVRWVLYSLSILILLLKKESYYEQKWYLPMARVIDNNCNSWSAMPEKDPKYLILISILFLN